MNAKTQDNGKRIAFTMIDGQEVVALTLTALRDRLDEMIAENDRRGWSERNQTPVVVEIPQPKTSTGRLRDSEYVPIMYGSGSLHGLMGSPKDQILGFAVLHGGQKINVASSRKAARTATAAIKSAK